MVVGATGERSNATGVNGNQGDNSATGAGAAYVFTRSGTTWTQQAYLKASNTGAGDTFGLSVAVSGDTVAVAAPSEDSNATGVNGNQFNNSASAAGAVYVFTRDTTTWTQQAYLKASNTGADDRFGESVAVSGNTVVVGADSEDSNATGVNGNQADNSASNAGAVYVFTVLPPPVRITSITKTGNSVLLQGLGVPEIAYEIEATENLALGFDPNPIGSATAGTDGIFQFTDDTALPQRFYRAVYP